MKPLFILMLLLQAFVLQAQVSGKVVDRQSGEPLAGAVVFYNNQQQLTTSQGVFNFKQAPGAFLICSFTGFETDTIHITAAGFVVVQMKASSKSLSDVVVTGTLKTVKRTESPVPVEIYTPAFFKKNPSPALFDALQLVNGVRPQLNCNVCNTGDIHINGLEGPYTMVLIDGMPIVSSLASVYGLFGIPNALVERIEVVKGPASSLYGSEAIGGLINIITKNPLKAPLLTADVMTTSWQEINTELGIKYNMGKKATALLGVSYFNYTHPVDKNNDQFTDITLQNRLAIFNKYSWQRQQNRLASLAARFIYEDRWGGEMRWNKQFYGGDSVYGENIITRRLELVGNYQLPTKEKLMLGYSFNAHGQRSAYGTTIFNANQYIGFAQLTWDKTTQQHDWLAGTVGRYTYYDDNTPATQNTSLRNQPDKILLPGIFLQDEIKLAAKQKLLLGIRYDHHKKHGAIITPRAAYKYSFNSNTILRFNAGTGFRTVNLFTEDHAALTGARTVVIKDALKPERSYNANINLLHKTNTKGMWLTTEFTAWYTHFTNRILPDYTTNANQIIYANLKGYSISKGASINAEFGFTNSLRGHLGITAQDVSVTDKSSGKKIRTRQLLTERLSSTWSLSYSFAKTNWVIDYTGAFYGKMLLPLLSATDPRMPQSPVWSIQNIQLTKKFKNGMEAYGGVKNFLNFTPVKGSPFIIARSNDPFDKQVQFDNSGQVIATPQNPYALTFDPNYVYAPNQGRRLFLGLRVTVK